MTSNMQQHKRIDGIRAERYDPYALTSFSMRKLNCGVMIFPTVFPKSAMTGIY